MQNSQTQFEADKKLLQATKGQGPVATYKTYFKLSGPGWLQSAITLAGENINTIAFPHNQTH